MATHNEAVPTDNATNMNRGFTLSAFALFALSASAPSQIAFIRHNAVYVVPSSASGMPVKGKKPFLVTKLWKLYPGDSVTVSWAPDRRLVLEHYVDAWNGKPRFGLSKDHPVTRLWMVEPKPHAKLTFLASGSKPTFSSDGKKVAYCWESYTKRNFFYHASILDLKTGRRTDLGLNRDQPTWSPSQNEFALVNGTDSSVDLVDGSTFKKVKDLGPSGIAVELSFSPNGRLFAIHHHLSRPLTGHEVLDVNTGEQVDICSPEKYAPPTLEDWSPDGKTILCDWRIQDPNNDGSARVSYVALSNLGKNPTGKRLGKGANPQFAPDGSGVLWTEGRRRAVVRFDLQTGRKQTVLSDVADFVIFKPHTISAMTVYMRSPMI